MARESQMNLFFLLLDFAINNDYYNLKEKKKPWLYVVVMCLALDVNITNYKRN